MKVVTAEEMRRIDERAQAEFGLSADELMLEAGRSIAQVVRSRLSPRIVCVVCGKGNNAGDGFVVARELVPHCVQVRVVCVSPSAELRGAAANAYHRMQEARVQEIGVDNMASALRDCDVVVDALLGTGVRGAVTGSYAEAIDAINRSRAKVVSADVPSGLRELPPGEEPGVVVKADVTVTIGLPKRSLYAVAGIEAAGEVVVAPIDFPPTLLHDETISTNVATDDELASWLPRRPMDANKGTFGSVGIVGGSAQYAGAAILAARAALRCGCGLVHIFTTASLNSIYKTALPEAITHIVPSSEPEYLDGESAEKILESCDKISSFVLGPGLGRNHGGWPQGNLVRKIIRDYNRPIVIDADGINALSSMNTKSAGVDRFPPLRENCVLTPHPGEMSRLLARPISDVLADPDETARAVARDLGTNVLLKGVPTIIALPGGQAWLNPGGNSALAKGGTGDVLSGAIASFIAQGMEPWKAAVLAARIHLKAGEVCARTKGERGVLASEVADALPLALLELVDGKTN